MKTDYFVLAFSNLKHQGLRSLLTMLGIFIGIAAVVSLISLGNGLQNAITGQFSTLDADKLIVQNAGTGFGPPGSTVVRKLTEHDLDLIKKTQGVDLVVPRLLRFVRVEFNKNIHFNFVASIPEGNEERELVYDVLNIKLLEGKLINSDEKGKIILGNNFIRDDEFEKKIRVGTILKIQGEEFEVAGILAPASTFQINSVISMQEEDLKKILNIDDEIDLIVVQVLEKEKTEEISNSIERVLRRDRNLDIGEEDFSVQTPVQGIQTINTILNIINIIVAGIAAVSLLVGSIGIANTMYTSVLERTKEIGIMKAIGAKNSDILIIFLIESGLLGLVGGIIGTAIGLGLAYFSSYLVSITFSGLSLGVQTSQPLLISAIILSFLLGIISGTLPAFQAAKLNTVEALRK